MTFSHRATAVLASFSLLPALAAVQALATTDAAATAPQTASAQRPADGEHRATIKRTSHGIPHIVASDYKSLGFGHGYATSETSICSLADTLLTG